jgi:hypothetical protein
VTVTIPKLVHWLPGRISLLRVLKANPWNRLALFAL